MQAALETLKNTADFKEKVFLEEFGAFRKDHEPVYQHIGPVYGLSGSGWSVSLVVKSYGFSHKGIALALKLLKVDAPVFSSRAEIRAFVANTPMGEKRCFVTDYGLLKYFDEESLAHHAVAVYLDRQEHEDRLFVIDCEGNSYLSAAKKIKKAFFSERQFALICASTERQKGGMSCCDAFSVEDCVYFQSNVDVCDELFKRAHPVKGHYTVELPDAMCPGKEEMYRRKKEQFQMVILSF